MTGLHFDEEYTLTEKRPADGYAVADDIVFRLERKTDADGHELDEADVYYLKDKKKLWIIPWEEWELLDDATVIMKDDITRVQISKVDIATGKELPGAELVIKDKDGNTVEPTEEETKAAMEAAKAKADAFVAAVNSSDDKETAFAELAPDYVSEDDKEDYEADPDASLHTGTVGSSLSYQSFGKWLMDDSRANGDVGVVESSSGYYAVMLLNRYRDETATADIRHILIKAEVADADDPATEDVDESKVPTQEALDAAKAEAEDILAQWEAGDKTAESFGALAEEYSDDPGSNTNGGLYEQVAPGVMFEGFNDWIFADGRAIGDTGLVENPQDGQQGWHIIYLEGWDEPVWKLTGKNALTNEKLNTWLEGLTENMEATQGAGVKYLGE